MNKRSTHTFPKGNNKFFTVVCTGIFLLLYFLCISIETKAQSRTPWQMHFADGPKVTGDTAEHYGDSTEYFLENIPPVNDPLWQAAPRGDLIEYAMASPFCHIGPDSTWSCRKWVDYTYFQTFITIPSNITLTTFTIRLRGIDDGVKVRMYNSINPAGFDIPKGYARLGDGGQTINLLPYAKKCESNRLVLTHVEDCCGWTALDSAYILMIGHVDFPADVSITSTPILCGSSAPSGTATASSVATGPFTYYWNTDPPQTTATATGLSAGTYICTVTPSVGCASAAAVTLSQSALSVSITPPTALPINTCAYGKTAHLILGYPGTPQQLSLTTNRSGGTSPYSYSWSGTGSQYLSSKTVRNPIFNPSGQSVECAAYNLVLTVRDSKGCVGSDTVEIRVINASSGSQGCGNNHSKKILICHVPPGNTSNPQTISISVNALSSHTFGPSLGPNSCSSSHKNDCVGTCNVQCNSANRLAEFSEPITESPIVEEETKEVYPSPNNGNFTLEINVDESIPVFVSVYNYTGQLIDSKQLQNLTTGLNAVPMQLSKEIAPDGIYFLFVKAGDTEGVVKKFSIKRD